MDISDDLFFLLFWRYYILIYMSFLFIDWCIDLLIIIIIIFTKSLSRLVSLQL